MNTATLFLVLLAPAPSWQEAPSATSFMGPTAKEIASAGEVFINNCVSCHQIPDSNYAVDRAWLARVAQTT